MATKPKRALKYDIMIASCAASGAVTISNPMEVVKTRLQLQGELQRSGIYVKSYKGFAHAFFVILRLEGIRGIQKGIITAFLINLQ